MLVVNLLKDMIDILSGNGKKKHVYIYNSTEDVYKKVSYVRFGKVFIGINKKETEGYIIEI